MRTRTIQMTDYFTRLLDGAQKPLAPIRASELLSQLTAARRRDTVPTETLVKELTAAYQLGVLHEVRVQAGVGWSVTADRLRSVSGDALPQAAEQAAALMALAAELLSAPSYEIQLDAEASGDLQIDAFSTIYNAELARVLGAMDVGTTLTAPQDHSNVDAPITTALHLARELQLRHGLRRSFRLVETRGHKEEVMKKQASTEPKPTVMVRGAWRATTDGRDHHLEWTVDSEGGKPVRIICALVRGTEAQRAAVETFVLFANRLLTAGGPRDMVRHCKDIRSSFFGGDEPLVAFVGQFAEQFLSDAERHELQLDDPDARQTDLLSAAEAVACERCGSVVEQFGDYAICLQCGDAQFVR